MTEGDKRHFDQRFNTLADSLEKMQLTIESLARGLYGDEKNKIKGLVDRQTHLETEFESLKEFLNAELAALRVRLKKFAWFGSGILVGLEAFRIALPLISK